MKQYINGKLYYQAREGHWLPSLAYYIYLCSKYSHKRFNVAEAIKSYKLKESNVYKHIAILESKGLIFHCANKPKGNYILASHKDVTTLYKGKIRLFTNKTENINEIKAFLKNVPLISNIYQQAKAIVKRDYYRSIKQDLESGRFVSMKDLRKLRNYEKKHGEARLKNEDPNLRISINGTMRILGVSNKTAIKGRNVLEEQGICKKKRVKNYINLPVSFYSSYKVNVDSKVRRDFFLNRLYVEGVTEFIILL